MALANTARVLVASFAFAPAVLAQGLPDCLLTEGNVDARLIRRLVDRDQNGYYDAATNEAYDYYRSPLVTAFRQIVPAPNQPGVYYAADGNYTGFATYPTPRIVRLEDADANGIIDPSEITNAYDMQALLGEADPECDAIATDFIAVYWLMNAGTHEGIWRSVDLNGDGDFEDNVGGVDETTPALVEATGDPVNGSNFHTVYNIPNTAIGDPGAVNSFYPSELQKIYFDPTTTPGSLAPGRFIIEDENHDQLYAVEDRNNDGDFYDADELYLFAAVNGNQNANNPVWRDTHPDHGIAFPQIADAMCVVDYTTLPATYYILEQQSLASGNAAENIVLRGRDLNADGDINDAGEINVFWQGADVDPHTPFNQMHFIATYGGDVYVTGDALLPVEHDQLLRLIDINGDGMIDNATEAFPVFDLPADRQGLVPNFFPQGELAPPPVGLPATVRYTGTASCVATSGTTHKLRIGGVAHGDDSPQMGTSFLVRTYDAALNSNGVIHIGFEFPAPIPLDINGECLLSVDPIMSGAFGTDGAGVGDLLLTAPTAPIFDGLSFYFESVVLDPGATAFNVTLSNGAECRFGQYAFTAPPNPF